MFRKLRKLARLSKTPSYIRGLWFGVAAGIENENFLKSHPFRTILDVGANKGQFTLVALACNAAASIVAFEPIGPAARHFRRLHGNASNVSLLEIGLGDENGNRTFHMSKRDDSSSFLPIASALRDLHPGTEEAYTTTFPVRRLDDVLRPTSMNAIRKRARPRPPKAHFRSQTGNCPFAYGLAQIPPVQAPVSSARP